MNKLNTIINYHYNGVLREKFKIDINGKQHGLYQSWYKDGDKAIECNFVDGKINGLYVHYMIDSKIEKNYVMGILQGPCIIYNKDGSIYSESFYVNDEEIIK